MELPTVTRGEIVRALCRQGHSVSMAIEIAIDAERGDAFSRTWIANAILAARKEPTP